MKLLRLMWSSLLRAEPPLSTFLEGIGYFLSRCEQNFHRWVDLFSQLLNRISTASICVQQYELALEPSKNCKSFQLFKY